jgi:hypothetical protein
MTANEAQYPCNGNRWLIGRIELDREKEGKICAESTFGVLSLPPPLQVSRVSEGGAGKCQTPEASAFTSQSEI